MGQLRLIPKPRKSRLFNPIRSFEAQTANEANPTYFGPLSAEGPKFRWCTALDTKSPSGQASKPNAIWGRGICRVQSALAGNRGDRSVSYTTRWDTAAAHRLLKKGRSGRLGPHPTPARALLPPTRGACLAPRLQFSNPMRRGCSSDGHDPLHETVEQRHRKSRISVRWAVEHTLGDEGVADRCDCGHLAVKAIGDIS